MKNLRILRQARKKGLAEAGGEPEKGNLGHAAWSEKRRHTDLLEVSPGQNFSLFITFALQIFFAMIIFPEQRHVHYLKSNFIPLSSSDAVYFFWK